MSMLEPAPVVKEEPKEAKVEAEGSQMIFPKLEKESPS
jgi:next-to-BRCA1 protein 1